MKPSLPLQFPLNLLVAFSEVIRISSPAKVIPKENLIRNLYNGRWIMGFKKHIQNEQKGRYDPHKISTLVIVILQYFEAIATTAPFSHQTTAGWKRAT